MTIIIYYSGVCTTKNLPSITFPTNLFAKNSSTKHLEEPSLIHEYQTEENEWELKDKAFSENGITIIEINIF